MEDQEGLVDMEKLFLALADKTRLRLLNLMQNGEVCVNLFSETLMLSQPKVSRHLAYLRKTGVVSTRRRGKWVYYRIDPSLMHAGNRVLAEALAWLSVQQQIQIDHERLTRLSGPQDEPEREFSGRQHENIQPIYEPRDEIETFLL